MANCGGITMKRLHKALLMPWANKVNYTQIVQQIAPANLIAYWVMGEPSGSAALDSSGNGRVGAYTAVMLGATGIGDGNTAASFDGSTSFNNIFSASFFAALNGSEGTISSWARVSAAGVWTDGTSRRVYRVATATAGNRIELYRTVTNNQMELDYVAGNTAKGVQITMSPTGFSHFAVTWSASGDAVKIYMNGVQQGATLTGLGVWAGTAAATQNVIGANITTPLSVWSGMIAHVAVWTTPLSAAQILSLATVP
jgi:hypothetical protein